MKKIISLIAISAIFCSCKSSPPEADISRCVLRLTDCGEYARVNSLHVVSSQEEEFLGSKMYKVLVDGEVEYTSPCISFSGTLRTGDKQKFKNKTVIMEKQGDSWVCP